MPGPLTEDELTAEVVARFAGVEMVLDESMEDKIAAILADFARRLRFDPDALSAASARGGYPTGPTRPASSRARSTIGTTGAASISKTRTGTCSN